MARAELAKPPREHPRGWHALLDRLMRPGPEPVPPDITDLGQDEPPPVPISLDLPPSQVARAALVLLGVGLGAYLLYMIQEVLFLLFLAILLATTIEPLVDRLRRGPFTRGTGVLAIYTVIIIVLGLPAVLLAPSAISQAASFATDLPTRIEALRPFAQQLQPSLVRDLGGSLLDQTAIAVKRPATPDGQTIVQAGATAAHVVLDFLLVFVIAFYWHMERNGLKRRLLRAVPRHRAKDVNTVWVELEDKLGAWVRGQLILMLVVGVVGGIGFIVLGLPSPIVLAVGAALGEMVPIVGPFLAFAPAVLIALATDPTKLPYVIGYAVVVQLVESNVLVPRIMEHAVGISPLTIILGIQAGAILYGLPGALLAVPVAAAFQVILSHGLGADNPAHEQTPTGSTSKATTSTKQVGTVTARGKS